MVCKYSKKYQNYFLNEEEHVVYHCHIPKVQKKKTTTTKQQQYSGL